MKKKNQVKMSRREFLKKNLMIAVGFLAGSSAAKLAPLWKNEKPGSNVSMKPGRHYKTLAG